MRPDLTISGMATGEATAISSVGARRVEDHGRVHQLMYFSALGNATVIAQGGVAVDGIIQLATQSPARFARVEVFGNGQLQVYQDSPVETIGSLEGDGSVILVGSNLAIGGNSLSTTFSGVIAEEGSPGVINKVGDTTLELSGASTYSGVTTVTGGILIVSNTTGSATGSGLVSVAEGMLGGSGIIAGAVTVGAGLPRPGPRHHKAINSHDPKRPDLHCRFDLHLHLQSKGQAGEDGQGDRQRSHNQERSELQLERDDQGDADERPGVDRD